MKNPFLVLFFSLEYGNYLSIMNLGISTIY